MIAKVFSWNALGCSGACLEASQVLGCCLFHLSSVEISLPLPSRPFDFQSSLLSLTICLSLEQSCDRCSVMLFCLLLASCYYFDTALHTSSRLNFTMLKVRGMRHSNLSAAISVVCIASLQAESRPAGTSILRVFYHNVKEDVMNVIRKYG